MGWTTPRTWVTNEVVTSAQLNTHVRDDLSALASCARVYNSANIAISNATNTALTFDSERFDNGGFHSTVTNTGRLTAPFAGVYLIGAHIAWEPNATGQRLLTLRVNGGTTFASTQNSGATANDTSSVAAAYALAATDYVEVVVFQDSGSAKNVNTVSAISPEFWISFMGATA